MTDPTTTPPPRPRQTGTRPPAPGPSDPMLAVKIVYGLYAVGYFVGITSLAGLIYAYITRGSDPLADSHFTFQIRTFWIGLGIGLVALASMVIGIGFLIWIFLLVWGLTRVISGFVLANDGRPITGSKYAGVLAV
ncbi:membrane protein-like protein [Dinoroseobacter shibae DFL 12 = DSM 16493]|uniref:Membrane protein-like protein n=1 Tax=Dinoroseobacter shibae (strain DSM 16493 / NCIMB 14021 / DFL 12) TaxID=398580 RepID=A8LRH4_DINSH|nr:membrane protein [Dinoroseobacter shibae]ABV92624.1 membrane protein-like protein [Dinoroseobacter shibae DFL 12 = DSM 16493]URF47562.1 hypothetical protein M8008_04535 [Dinoroseobacter shibae]URF51872.1 hypothetical protein M8007_04535 [Dinoroseobacter shibae]